MFPLKNETIPARVCQCNLLRIMMVPLDVTQSQIMSRNPHFHSVKRSHLHCEQEYATERAWLGSCKYPKESLRMYLSWSLSWHSGFLSHPKELPEQGGILVEISGKSFGRVWVADTAEVNGPEVEQSSEVRMS